MYLFYLVCVSIINFNITYVYSSPHNIKEIIISNQRSIALEYRFTTMGILDTYLFSLSSCDSKKKLERDNILIQPITGRMKLSQSNIYSLIRTTHFLFMFDNISNIYI